MGKEPIKRIGLDSQLTLVFIDNSKHVAADRWLISVKACVAIPLDPLADGPNGLSADQIKTLKDMFGNQIAYEKEMDRNFIDAAVKDQAIQEMMSSFIDSTLRYLNHPDFPRRYALKTLAEIQSKTSYYKDTAD